MREYDYIAEWYVAARNPEVGVADLTDFSERLSPGARVLDVGCGGGVPISRYLLRKGLEVVGLDSSHAMIDRYRAHFPSVPTRCARVQDASFAAASFEGVVGWGVLFHLSAAEQRAVVANVSVWLKPGGWFLFTSGDAEDESEGEMNGVVFPYVSLGMRGYREVLEQAGMRLVDTHRDAWDNHVYVAQKTA